ncbi:NifU family protein [Microscilla marina]|uniref:Conserved domain protein n=1 Tax=Microscilla marina ATCC 23134 TaxID=313606 RepID=A1ZWL1_MICM2|nr:NifU family protein [Microscilla marina]EAY25251.1 conserved domain protein [Microscilla marina ATCC 23134]
MDTTIDMIERVDNALDTIRPYLKTDGGDVKVLEVSEDGVVKLELMGSCGSCPMSAMTLKAGIEESIRKAVPEITAVEAINMTPM